MHSPYKVWASQCIVCTSFALHLAPDTFLFTESVHSQLDSPFPIFLEGSGQMCTAQIKCGHHNVPFESLED